MDLDFKDRTFSFLKLKKKRLRRRVFFITSLLFIFSLFLFFRNQGALKHLRKGESLFMEKGAEAALSYIEKHGSSLFRRDSFRELKGVLNLADGRIDPGAALLGKISPGTTSVQYEKILTHLADNGLYIPLDVYSSLLPDRYEPVRFFRMVADTALYRADESEKKIKKFRPEDPDKYSRHLPILRDINRQVRSGKVHFIFDRDGNPIARYEPETENCVSLLPGIDFSTFSKELRMGLKYTKLSIRKDTQMKIHRLFSRYSGSFILTDLEDGSILASYSKPYSGEKENTALTQEYEPGSVIKLITLFAWSNSGKKNLFPFHCRGNTSYDGKIFYDWKKHGTLKGPEAALARSCNLVFAEMGIRTGRGEMGEFFKNFLFNSPAAGEEKFRFHFGKFTPSVGNIRDLANLSIGLEHITITTVHSAILSSIFAQDGNIIFPYFIVSSQNIFGLAYRHHSPQYKQVYLNNRYFADVKRGMREVTSDMEGTGRRAMVSYMDTGIKTGTAGKKSKGFDSVLTGFFPYEKPKYAFAFRLEHGGKAEYHGALFLKDFLNAFYNRKKR